MRNRIKTAEMPEVIAEAMRIKREETGIEDSLALNLATSEIVTFNPNARYPRFRERSLVGRKAVALGLLKSGKPTLARGGINATSVYTALRTLQHQDRVRFIYETVPEGQNREPRKLYRLISE